MSFLYNPPVVILPWPQSVECSERILHRSNKTSRQVSPLSRATQTQELVGGRWNLSLRFPPLDAQQQRTLRVFIARLKGRQGLFYFPADSTVAPIPPQSAGADVVATGPRLAAQVSPGQLNTQGWDEPEGTLVISAGEHISFDDATGWRRLHRVVEDCYAGPGGTAAMKIEPPVRCEAPVNGRLHVACPNGVFRLASDDQGAITQTADGFGQVSISAVEAFPLKVVVP